MAYLTPPEERQLQQYWHAEEAYAQDIAQSSERSFLGWLRSIGLDYLVGKVVDYGWQLLGRMLRLW